MDSMMPLPQTTDAERAYAAGFVDGEGSIGIYGGSKAKLAHALTVRVSQKDPRPLLWLQARWAGNISKCKHNKFGAYRGYQWQVTGRRAESFLREIRVYLVLKGDQADVAFAFRATIGTNRGNIKRRGLGSRTGFDPSTPVTPEKFAAREGFKLRLQELKQVPEVA